MRAEFDAELQRLEAEVQEAGNVTVQGIRGAIVALEDWEPPILDHLTALDERVDVIYRQVETDVEQMLARQAPVATDLRIVLGVLYTNVHLERMSHNCLRIGRLATPVDGAAVPREMVALLKPALLRGAEMTRVALDAFALRDEARARELPEMDELVDHETGALVQLALERGPGAWSGNAIFLARSAERIADHAVRIAEQALYVVTARRIEFSGSSAA